MLTRSLEPPEIGLLLLVRLAPVTCRPTNEEERESAREKKYNNAMTFFDRISAHASVSEKREN